MDAWTAELDKLANDTAVQFEHYVGETRELNKPATTAALQNAISALLALRVAVRSESR